jgi:hypothetical protein
MSDIWVQTRSGIRFDYVDLTPEMMVLEDIVGGMSKACRYGNQCEPFYSVAEHCLLVAAMMTDPAYERTALLHDAAEAYTGDIISPLKQLFGEEVKKTEARIMQIVSDKFGVFWPILDVVKRADIRARDIELDAVYRSRLPDWKEHILPAEDHEKAIGIEFLLPDPAEHALRTALGKIGMEI